MMLTDLKSNENLLLNVKIMCILFNKICNWKRSFEFAVFIARPNIIHIHCTRRTLLKTCIIKR